MSNLLEIGRRTESIAAEIDRLTRPGELATSREDGRIECNACGHRCRLAEGQRGICKVRFVRDGTLRVPWGYTSTVQLDPIEKKPMFHAFSGGDVLTFGMLGCDLRCSYCQNWQVAHSLRDDNASGRPKIIDAEKIVELAVRNGASCVASSFNEPLITAEWAVEVFSQARRAGLGTAFISNGNATAEALDLLAPHIDAFKIDLKSMSVANYKQLGGRRDNILETIKMVHERGIWLELVTLLVPGWNTAESEVVAAAEFIADVSPDIPWHLWNFHKDYKMTEPDDAKPDDLLRAARLGRAAGLNHVYAGVMPGLVEDFETTFCSGCGEPLIERLAFSVNSYQITGDGHCGNCDKPVPGLWPSDPATVRTTPAGLWFERKSQVLAQR